MIRAYERHALKLLSGLPKKRAVFAKFVGNKLQVVTETCHRTPAARLWRLFWRMKK